MRLGLIVLLTLTSLTVTASAQTVEFALDKRIIVTSFEAGPASGSHASPDDVLARLMSHDRDRSGSVATAELPERMQHLVTRGDVNRDGALDVTEILILANAPPAVVTVQGFPVGHYAFGEDVGVSSRMHIDGALDDLRLAGAAREEAVAVVKAFVDALESSASANLLKEMESLLTVGQLANFKEALARQSLGGSKIFISNGPSLTRVMAFGLDLGRTVEQYNLPPEEHRRAKAAVEGFKAQLRPGEAERSALLDQMNGILTDEERNNFRAALERRPLVKAGGPMIAGPVRVESFRFPAVVGR